MILKKIKILGLAVVLVILVGCEGNNGLVDSVQEDGMPVIEENRGTPQVVENIEDFQKEDEPYDYLRAYRNFDGIVLRNLLTDEVVAEITFSLEEDQAVQEVYEFANGYYGALMIDGVDILRDEDGELVGMSWTGEGNATFFLFDSELNLIDEFEITSDNVNRAWSNVIVFEGNEILIYYYDNWESGLYVYNLMTNLTIRVEIDLDKEIFVSQLHQTDIPNQLAFVGTRTNDEFHTYLGVMDLETGHVQYKRTDFQYNHIVISGNYFLLTERVQPAFMGGVPEGKAMIVNMLTGQEHLLQVEGYESMRGMVIANRYFLTGSHEHIRLYDIVTNEMVLEREPSVQLLPRVESTIGANGEHIEGVYPGIQEFFKLRQGLYAVVFDIGDGTQHMEFIVIEE